MRYRNMTKGILAVAAVAACLSLARPSAAQDFRGGGRGDGRSGSRESGWRARGGNSQRGDSRSGNFRGGVERRGGGSFQRRGDGYRSEGFRGEGFRGRGFRGGYVAPYVAPYYGYDSYVAPYPCTTATPTRMPVTATTTATTVTMHTRPAMPFPTWRRGLTRATRIVRGGHPDSGAADHIPLPRLHVRIGR